MSDIEKGILKDGLNLMNNDLLLPVGGENNPSVQGVKEFVLGFSELINREISAMGYSVDGSGNISDIVIGNFNDNTYTHSSCGPDAISHKYNGNFTMKNIVLFFHTHPDGKLGATQYSFEVSKDIQKKNIVKQLSPNAKFLVLYRPYSRMEEFDYTNK